STPQQATGNRRNITTNDMPRARPRPDDLLQVETVCAMFPNIPQASIQYDLQKTGSVEVTCDNILQNGGSLPPPPVATSFAIPSTSQASSSSTSTSVNSSLTQQSLIDRYKLQEAVNKGLVPSDPPKKWETTPERRQELLQQKKDAMVLQARERYLEQQRKKKELEAKTSSYEYSSLTDSTQSLNNNSLKTQTIQNVVEDGKDLEPELRRQQILQATERRWKKE
ncbi:1741_t:CDS:2, partial [Acaulospora morrowiae]